MPVYAVYFPELIYNCQEASYELTPLPDSIIKAGKVFACNKQIAPAGDLNGTLAVALRLKANLGETTHYKSIERLKNLVCLSYGSFAQEVQLRDVGTTIDDIVKTNLSERFYNPDVRYGGQLDWDLPLRIAAYSQLIVGLESDKQAKFWKALQTFCYARLIAHLPNPQYKYTLYMTLHLASINQLADEPKNYHIPPGNLVCSECGEKLDITHHTSHVYEIEKLICTLVPNTHAQTWVKFMKKKRNLYHSIRSRFIHNGDFAGLEDVGGFMALWGSNLELAENDINLMILNRTLLEQFLKSNQPPSERGQKKGVSSSS